jgi:uncharacterized membrane protein YphA (DoxX/SURF4 family)
MLLKKWNFMLNRAYYIFKGAYSEKNFLSFFRISVSLIAIIDLLSMYSDIPLLFSTSKTVLPQELMYLTSEYFTNLHFFYNYLVRNNLDSLFYSSALWLYLIALVFLLIGLFSRFSAIFALLFQLIIFKSFAVFNYGYDNFLTMSLFYCVIFPVGKYYSLSSKIFIAKTKNSIFNYQRVIQIHLCMVYFFSGIFKSFDTDWWNGNSMWKALSSIYNNYSDIYPIILATIGIGSVILETFYPFLVYKKQTRLITIYLCILMHSSIAVLMDLYAFSAILIVWNIAAFSKLTTQNKVIDENIT